MRTIFKNAHLFTATPQHSSATSNPSTCLIINNNLIEYIGPSTSPFVLTAESQGCTIRDVRSLTITPGFIDGHMHLLLFGSDLLKIHLDDCKSLDDIRSTIRKGAEERPNANRLFCSGWMHSMTDGKALASTFDDIDPQGRPIFINSKDLHSVWCNSAALREMEIRDTPDPEGGKIHRDSAGNPSGLLEEAATLKIVWPHTAKVTSREENLVSIREAIKAYNAAGYTGVIELATDEEIWSLMKQVREEEEDEVPLRFAAHWLITPSKATEENLAQVDRAITLHKQYNLTTSPDFRIAGIKIICDGVIDACTAALREPYNSTATNSDTIWSAEQLRPVVEKADKAGLQVALHAIGDAAVTLAVNALESCSKNRHRIEHLELTSPEDSKRLGELGITASIQPVHSDPSILLAWPSLLSDRCSRAFAYQEFHDNGAKLAIGTDSPTAPHLPLRNLYVATTRKSARQPDANLEPVNEHFKLSFEIALTAATAGSAYACFAEQRVGTLEVGKIADFVVLDLHEGSNDLLKAEVKETWFAGKKVYPT